MTDNRLSIFISHKISSHELAARRIKEILESHSERIDVHICEDTPAGDRWREWIQGHISESHILLVLIPQKATDFTWVASEIGMFDSICPDGRLIALKHPADPIPGIIQDRQIIDASKHDLVEQFLKPLYHETQFVKLNVPLNNRIIEADLERVGEEIEQILLGMVDMQSKFFGEYLIVETVNLDITKPDSLGDALVRAPNGCSRILNWNNDSFSWNELQARAIEEKGKGTFWIKEMEQVINEVARQANPRLMTSTFRGRGLVAGQIFRPQLECVDFVDDKPVRFHFSFHEVLVPELVRGPERIGDVFNLLHIATRVRWEVLNPFLDKLSLAKNSPSPLETSPETRKELINQVLSSLRVIEQEEERHRIVDSGIKAFSNDDRFLIDKLLREREPIKKIILAAAERDDFEQFKVELMKALDLNCRVTEMLTSKFLELIREDCGQVMDLVQKFRSKDDLLPQ